MQKTSVRLAGVIPKYATEGSAGADLFANIKEPLCVAASKRVLVPTGTFIEVPAGFEGQVRSRSGLSFRYGILVLNSPGTIDSDYRGEIKVPLVNISEVDYTIQPMERIAQLIIALLVQVRFAPVKSVSELSKTVRDESSFGESGKF